MSSADTGRPGPHPDHDLLADLAAEVLTEDIAVQIQGHVISCPDCADLLAEAEGIRVLLRRSEPEIMPDDVLDRLEATLVAARRAVERGEDPAVALAARSGSTGPIPATGPAGGTGSPVTSAPGGSVRPGAFAAPPTPVTGVSGPQSPPGTPPGTPAGGVPGGRRIQPSVPGTGRIPATTEGNRTLGRLRGRAVEATGARRQARQEERDDEPGLLERLLPVLRIAAVVVLVLGLGGVAVHFIHSGSSGPDESSGSAATAAGPPVLAPVEATDTNYRKDDLKSQVGALVAQSQKAPAATSASTGQIQPNAAASGTARGGTTNSAVQDGSQQLRSQPALRSCLEAIGHGGDQPVAVDLARYAGQEAAIIVLNGTGGGYQVWVVARTCAQGADGTIDVESVPAS